MVRELLERSISVNLYWLIPIAAIVAYLGYRYYQKRKAQAP